MSIIITRGGREAKRVDRSAIEKEGALQEYIANNPASIPVRDVKDGAELLVIGREFATSAGPIDVLAIDADGDIYVLETKRYKNPDKRQVVAQMLDYGAALWKGYADADLFIRDMNVLLARAARPALTEQLKRAYEFDDAEAVVVVDALRQNLSRGVIKFVVLMDQLNESLKELVQFINANSNFDIYAVEMEFYRHGDVEIVVPRLHGGEVKKLAAAGRSGRASTGDSKTKQDFLDELEGLDISLAEPLRDLCAFSEMIGEVEWKWLTFQGGVKAHVRAGGIRRRVYSFDTEGELLLDFMESSDWGRQQKERFKQELRTGGFPRLPAPGSAKQVSLAPEEWVPHLMAFKNAVQRMTAARV